MAYYPKSQILTNLYTNGGEYVLSSTNQEYIGSYYELSSGQKYSGKSPIYKPNILLIPFQNNDVKKVDSKVDPPLVNTINNYPNSTPAEELIFLPQYNQPLPTPDDYKKGMFTRYFCKKNNEHKYLELDQITYNKLLSKDPSILWSLYTPFSIPWKITSDSSQNSSYNQSSVSKLRNSGKYVGFFSYIRDYSQYTLEETPSPSTSNISQPQPPPLTPPSSTPPPSMGGGGYSGGGGGY